MSKSDLSHLPRRGFFVDAPKAERKPLSQALHFESASLSGGGSITVVSAKPKGGRPALYPDKPWEALGISRMTWYRRNRKK